MNAVKEKLINAINVMNNEEALTLWEYLTHIHDQTDIWDSLEETDPTAEESQILDAYENGDERYQPHISHEDLKKELGIS